MCGGATTDVVCCSAVMLSSRRRNPYMHFSRRRFRSSTALAGAVVAGSSLVSAALAVGPKCVPAWSAEPGVTGIADSSVNALHPFGDKMYAVGNFLSAQGVAGTQNIAAWNGSTWESVGGGMSGGQFTNALEVFNGELYVGGYFSGAGGVAGTEKLAAWTGTTWKSVNAQLASFLSSIWALRTWDDGNGEALYIGGNFLDIGGNTGFDHIVKYDGANYTQLGGTIAGAGIPLGVFSFGVWDDGNGEALYMGGRFSSVDGVPANRIAKWDGKTWSALGTGLAGPGVGTSPYDILEFEGSLYIGGQSIDTAGGVAVLNVARWDGMNWHAVGDGLAGVVWDLEVYDDGTGPALYAVGLFTASGGGTPIDHVAKLVNGKWIDAGSGANDNCYASYVADDGDAQDLWVGGAFTQAAGTLCRRVMRLDGCPLPLLCAADMVDSATFQPPPDGVVDAADLAFLLGAWGRNPGSAADIVSSDTFAPPPDGVVDAADLAFLLGDWGVCE
jgi:hypothetical protein